MKSKVFTVCSLILLAACSTPKYTYKFDYHDYNAGRPERQAAKEVASNPGPVTIQPELLVAEAPEVVPTPEIQDRAVPRSPKSAPLTLTKAEKKEMIKDLKKVVKEAKQLKKNSDVDQSSKAMDYNLKMALIFLVVSLASGLLYWVSPPLAGILGLIALIIAIVFFVKWIAEQ